MESSDQFHNSHQAVLRLDVVFGVADEHVLDDLRVRHQDSGNAVEEVVARDGAILLDEPEKGVS